MTVQIALQVAHASPRRREYLTPPGPEGPTHGGPDFEVMGWVYRRDLNNYQHYGPGSLTIMWLQRLQYQHDAGRCLGLYVLFCDSMTKSAPSRGSKVFLGETAPSHHEAHHPRLPRPSKPVLSLLRLFGKSRQTGSWRAFSRSSYLDPKMFGVCHFPPKKGKKG